MFLPGAFQRKCAASIAMKKETWSPIVNEEMRELMGKVPKMGDQDSRPYASCSFANMKEKDNVYSEGMGSLLLWLEWLVTMMDYDDSF